MRAARSRLLVFSSTHVVLVAKCVFAEVYLLPGLEARVVRLSVSEGVGRGGAEEGDDESGGRVGGQRGGGSGLETRECSRAGKKKKRRRPRRASSVGGVGSGPRALPRRVGAGGNKRGCAACVHRAGWVDVDTAQQRALPGFSTSEGWSKSNQKLLSVTK